ncbi:ATP phosphoribosyltransferase regulatory subunit [Paenibacillus thermoaerophilus]|uniref:ATP phosphoribosyltransferase regulatory subunit n=1 Tax=Paenibacillus thermoaerophilus TaxID=1215385 RepID=A0ABW2V8S0_9BACL|nr:ATP phosphoribosyltransferase regulatory subunit [Paenibacillus thermoaerophilus]TMV08394.1 ATP phosphoribosyltransferase regulatory subunit [Paenibacillus thermoaerophilus]
MSKPKVFEKPAGLRDYLPEAAARLRQIELSVLDCIERWGYRQIITPTLEYYDTVGVASSTSDKKLFKLLDRNGTTIVLRPELTAPIARVVASLLKQEPFPLRLSYHSNVFRAFDDEAGKESEFLQTGVELIGDGTAEADAEIIALAVACLEAAGVPKFKLAVGHAGFLHGLFEELLPNRPEQQYLLKECLINRDFVGFREQLAGMRLKPEVHAELEGILRLRGGREICQQAHGRVRTEATQDALMKLCEVWDVLQAYGVSDRVSIDLTLIGDFSYYTGITFEGYAADLGFPVVSGGRYDNLLGQFGRPAPATGFALKTNRILEIATGLGEPKRERVLVLYAAHRRDEALRQASELRRQGTVIVETRRLADENAEHAAASYSRVLRLE